MNELIFSTLFATILNFTLMIAIIYFVCKGVKGFKNMIAKQKVLEDKIEILMDKLDSVDKKEI